MSGIENEIQAAMLYENDGQFKEPLSTEIRVLDHGFVRLDGWMNNGDLSVVNSARVSFGAYSTSMIICGECGEDKKTCGHKSWNDYDRTGLRSADAGLIKFLMKERHGTPFEHTTFRFHVKAPLFVVREWQRHRMASYNELSGRYKEFENPDFYIPDEYRTQNGRPGDYKMDRWQGNHEKIQALTLRHYQDCYDLYKYQIEQGIAKEMARNVLPLAMYTEFYYTVNPRSLMNFLSLRNAPTALYEIREYASVIEALWAEKMPVTAKAFVDNDRVAP